MNFQAAVTAICAVHLLRGTPVGWLAGLADDTPTAIWAETNGPGDDIRLETSGGTIEVQAKKGLVRGTDLWAPLLELAGAVRGGVISHGVLALAPDSSATIRDDLSRDLQRLGDGREDDLTDIGADLLKRLKAAQLPVQATCSRLRIQVVHALEADRADVQSALLALRQVCAREGDAARAWDALYRAATEIIARKGRWELPRLLGGLAAVGVEIRDADFPAALLARLTAWVAGSNTDFSLPGVSKRIPLSEMLPMRTVAAQPTIDLGESASAALERYHASGSAGAQAGDRVFDAEWTGRFRSHSVVVAGPGLGKSTLITQLAHYYAADGHPVLRVTLKSVAASMRSGVAFEDSILQWGLDGSGITPQQFREARLGPLVLLADGLDDCGDQHHDVAAGLVRFASGHPDARIVVTTRPVGYLSDRLSAWRHNTLRAPEKDSGAPHLAALIRAATDDPTLARDALDVAGRELGRTAAAPAIASSPQMLAMAASLVVRRGHLPASRGALYKQMLAAVAMSPRAAGHGTEAVANRVLDVIGWTLVRDPLALRSEVVAACAAQLASDLAIPTLAATERVEAVLGAWESAGLIERLHHPDGVLTTFIHKSFAEFTAARLLMSRAPEERQRELERIVDDQGWSEVVSFAGGLGAGDEIASMFVERQARGTRGQITRALALLGDPDAHVSVGYSQALIDAAFEAVARNDDEGFVIGVALAELAATQADLVGPPAAARLDSLEPAVRLVAWAAAIAAGPAWHNPSQIADILAELTPQVSRPAEMSLLGGLRVSFRKDRDLLQAIGLAALAQTPDDQVDDFIERALDGPGFGNFGFQRKLEAALAARGRGRQRPPSWMARTRSNLLSVVREPRDWSEAARAAMRAVAGAVATDPSSEPSPCAGQRLLHFGALVELTGLMEAYAGDVYAWTEPFDADAARETLRLLVVASGLDASALAAEAAEVLRRLDANPDLSIFRLDLPSADAPDPVWERVVQAHPDYDLLRRALAHSSAWLVELATTLLQPTQPDEVALSTLLTESAGFGLAAAAHLITVQLPERAQELLVQHLSNAIRTDSKYVLRTLRERPLAWNDQLAAVLRSALHCSYVEVAIAAAELVEALVAAGVLTNSELPELAFQHWLNHEQPTPLTGVVPSSPRASLLRSLLALGSVDDERLVGLLQDPRGDASGLAEERLVPRLEQSDSLREQVAVAIAARRVPPAIAARLLAANVPFNQGQVADLGKLLADDRGEWRLAAMKLLRSPLISEDEIRRHAERLSNDSEAEVRERAKSILRGLSSRISGAD